MAHPEIELISNVLETGNFPELKKKGVTRDLFSLDSAKEVFTWLWDEFHNPSQKGEVPTVGRMKRKFPDFDFAPSRNSVSALISDIRRSRAQIKLNQLMEQIQEEMLSDSDPALILDGFLPKLRELNVETSEESGLTLVDAAEIIRQDYGTKKQAGGLTGIPFPWGLVNGPTGGMQDEQFIVIYGRPGNMKTWIACVMAAVAWQANRRVMFFSKEISSTDILKRICSVLGGIDYAKLRAGNLGVEEESHFFDLLDALDGIEEDEIVEGHRRALLCTSDKGKRKASTVEDLMASAERFEPDIIFVDGFYLMRDARSGQRTADWKQIAHISQDLKGLAQWMDCPVVGTTQANRANAKQPTGDLDDLSFADAIGMDADIAVRAFRGPNPSGRGASIMLVWSKVREAVIRPFVINACPGWDFSVLEKTVNIKQFLERKNIMEQQEAAASSGVNPSAKTKPAPKKKKRGDPFRD